MGNLTSLQNTVASKLAALDREEQAIKLKLVAIDRERVLNAYLARIRYHRQVAEFNRLFPDSAKWPEPPTHDQCEAAVLILTLGAPEQQEMFLAASVEG